MELLELALKKWYTKKWLTTEYNLLSYKWYCIHWQYDTEKEAEDSLWRWMMYYDYRVVKNPNYKK